MARDVLAQLLVRNLQSLAPETVQVRVRAQSQTIFFSRIGAQVP